MLWARHWSVRHSRLIEIAYRAFERMLMACRPIIMALGPRRIERPVATIERLMKGFMFDCRMCGSCALSVTGMSCPMNCPKLMRNGPCGGVRPDGGCEVKPDMQCVWVEGWRGSLNMSTGGLSNTINPPVEADLAGFVRRQRNGISGQLGKARHLVEADAKARFRTHGPPQQAALNVLGHRRAAVADGKFHRFAALQACTHGELAIERALPERVLEKVFGDALEQLPGHEQGAVDLLRLELNAAVLISALQRLPPEPRLDVVPGNSQTILVHMPEQVHRLRLAFGCGTPEPV